VLELLKFLRPAEPELRRISFFFSYGLRPAQHRVQFPAQLNGNISQSGFTTFNLRQYFFEPTVNRGDLSDSLGSPASLTFGLSNLGVN
jgi:hypothetical protein